MRFFGWTWQELMQTPIFGFWVCYRQMNRIMAQENLRTLHVNSAPNMKEDDRRSWVDSQIEAIGEVVREKRTVHAIRDPDAGARLKAFAKVKKAK